MSRGDKYTEECWCCVLACLSEDIPKLCDPSIIIVMI